MVLPQHLSLLTQHVPILAVQPQHVTVLPQHVPQHVAVGHPSFAAEESLSASVPA